MTTVYNITNHELTQEQIQELKEKYKANNIISFDKQQLNVNPNFSKSSVYDMAYKILSKCHIDENSIFIIQCEYGLTYALIDILKNQYGINKIFHATSKRDVVEYRQNNRIIKQTVFKHIQFREY